MSAVQETGQVPPGNQRDNDTWTVKRVQKGEIKLTPGKGVQDLSCSVTDLIEQVVKGNKVALPPSCMTTALQNCQRIEATLIRRVKRESLRSVFLYCTSCRDTSRDVHIYNGASETIYGPLCHSLMVMMPQ